MQNSYNRSINEKFLDIENSHFLQQVVTRLNNTLDLFFTNNESFVNRVETFPGISNHDAVFIENNLQPKRFPMVKRNIKQYKKGDFDKTKEEFEIKKNEIENNYHDSLTANELWKLFKNKVESLVDKYVPVKTLKKDRNYLTSTNILKNLTKGLTNITSVPFVHVLISTTNLLKLSFKKNLGKLTSKLSFQVMNPHQQTQK